ncbi:hypothetical protein Droror1_Dr00027020 [Drosera rotundifolia]
MKSFFLFTIAVVNKDPKKSKYSDTLHRFWKEHDWGWKKFMELSKLSDGFLDDDTLIIWAQVQVIRSVGLVFLSEKTGRPAFLLQQFLLVDILISQFVNELL